MGTRSIFWRPSSIRNSFAARNSLMESHHYLGYEQPVGEHLTADRNYIKEFSLGRSRELGKQYGVEYAEAFHYIPPGAAGADRDPRIDAYIKEHVISR